ncbi:MAG: ABC transporter permease [Candidatus Zixiibacteriota bacterium]|nr:MAG: ABC transporter permease [candidate division Zixibacteria bacterium]
MFWHYLKVSLRNFLKRKSLSAINIAGLTIGMTCCVLILLWVMHERSFDKFHDNADDLYLVAAWVDYGSNRSLTSNSPPALAPVLTEEYPEIIRATRFTNVGSLTIRNGDKVFMEQGQAVDESFLEMFTFPLAQGDVGSALTEPYSMVITPEMAAKYFDGEDALGKVLEVEGRFRFTVTGVLQKIPDNSSMQLNYLVPFATLAELWNDPQYPASWTNWNMFTYIQLQAGVSAESVQAKIADRVNRSNKDSHSSLFLALYADIYMHGFGPVVGRFVVVALLSAMALSVLVIACLNFMNLATARSAARAREIGLRKVAGAHRRDIVIQFYGESFLLAFISLMFTLALVEVLLPFFNNLVDKKLALDIVGNPGLILALAAVAFFTGAVAGSYPALFMAAFQPAKIFTGIISSGPRRSTFIKSFVLWQFAASIILVVATLVIQKQLHFVQQKDPGYNKQDLVYISLKGESKNRYEALKNELLQHPDVLTVCATSRIPTGVYDNGSKWQWKDRLAGTDPLVTYFGADGDFLETFGTEMVAGAYFDRKRSEASTVTTEEVIINEAFADVIGADSPLGMQIHNYGRSYTIIGVMKNFNFKPYYWRIEPMMLYQKSFHENNPNRYNYLFARLRTGRSSEAIAHMQKTWEAMGTGFPLMLRFLEDDFGLMYDSERRFAEMIRYAAFVMIFVACLGLFGIAAFTVEQRIKEVGVRKVMGASAADIVRLMCRRILTPVLIANLVAWIISYLVLKGWLMTRFAYRTSIGWQPLVTASVLTLSVAMASIIFQAIRAAQSDPVESLRHE